MNLTAPVDAADGELRDASRALSARWPVVAGLLLSLLLHLMFGFLLVELPDREDSLTQDVVIPIEFIAEPPAPPPVPKLAPTPPPSPPPPPEIPAESPKAAAAPALPPQVVQRETAPTAQHSSAPRPQQPRAVSPAAPVKPVQPRPAENRDGLLPALPPVEKRPALGITSGRTTDTAPVGPVGEKLSQSEVDFLLSQVLRVWLIDYHAPRFKDIVISGNFQLNPDGTLGAPFGVNDPWTLERMVSNYSELLRPDARDQRAAIESFLAAMRQAQPFQRQADAPPMISPKILSFSFRLGDL